MTSASGPGPSWPGEPGQARFSAVYQRYHGNVFRYAWRRVGRDQAEDIASETFAVLWARLEHEYGSQPWCPTPCTYTPTALATFDRKPGPSDDFGRQLTSFAPTASAERCSASGWPNCSRMLAIAHCPAGGAGCSLDAALSPAIWKGSMEPGFTPSEIDTSRPHPARLYDYFLGGKDNYVVDREAAEAVLRLAPEARDIAHENRAFLGRVVRYLVGEVGIRQIIDIGTGIPTLGNVHEVAHQIDPAVRVAYVDNDPIVHVHASALLAGQGSTSIVLADVRDPAGLLARSEVQELIDFRQPVAVLMIAIVHFITDQEEPGRIISAFRAAVAPGSYFALSHATADLHDEIVTGGATKIYARATAPLVPRSRAQVTAMFEGWDLIEPGVVQIPLWRPDGGTPHSGDLAKIAAYGGVARKRAGN